MSEKAKRLTKYYGEPEVKRALRKIFKGDASSANKLLRVADLDATVKREAINHLKSIEKKGTSELTQPDPNTTKRTLGFSQRHLMILATLQEKEEQLDFFRQSIDKRWDSDELRIQIQAWRGGGKVRPVLELASLQRSLQSLKVSIGKFVAGDASAKAEVVKDGTLKRGIWLCEQCDSAIEELKPLIKNACHQLSGLKQALETRMSTPDAGKTPR